MNYAVYVVDIDDGHRTYVRSFSDRADAEVQAVKTQREVDDEGYSQTSEVKIVEEQ